MRWWSWMEGRADWGPFVEPAQACGGERENTDAVPHFLPVTDVIAPHADPAQARPPKPRVAVVLSLDGLCAAVRRARQSADEKIDKELPQPKTSTKRETKGRDDVKVHWNERETSAKDPSVRKL